MKKLLFLLLLPFIATAQVRTPNLYLKNVNGRPAINPQGINDYAVDWKAKQVWRGISTTGTVKWTLEADTSVINFFLQNGIKGDKGDPGPMGPQGQPGASITGPMGPQGPPGVCPACPPSGGSSPGRTFITPHLLNDFGEIVIGGHNSTFTVAQAGVNPAVYAGITVLSTDLYDWANLQYAMYLEQQSGKPISTYGTFKGINKMIDIGKYNTRLLWNGNFAVLQTIGGTPFSVVGRPQPTDNSDANLMIAATYKISQLEFKCSPNQKGLEPGPTYASVYTQIIVSGAHTAIQLDFNLDATVQSSVANNCLRGFIFDFGKWQSPSLSSAQSNGSYCINSRCYYGAGFIGEVAFGVYSSGGVTIESCIAEGNKVKRGIEFDGMGNLTTKRNYVNNFHWETAMGTDTAGSGEAAIYIRAGGGVFEVSNLKADYASCMIDGGSQGGWMTIVVRNVSWWKMPSNGKFIYNAPSTNGGTTWKLWYVEKMDSEIMAGFAGKPVTQACSSNNDANKVCIQ